MFSLYTIVVYSSLDEQMFIYLPNIFLGDSVSLQKEIKIRKTHLIKNTMLLLR